KIVTSNKLLIPVALTLLVWMGTACTEDFDELNTNPTLLTEDRIRPEYLFTQVLKFSIFDSYQDGRIGEFSGYYASQSSGNIISGYDYSSSFFIYLHFCI